MHAIVPSFLGFDRRSTTTTSCAKRLPQQGNAVLAISTGRCNSEVVDTAGMHHGWHVRVSVCSCVCQSLRVDWVQRCQPARGPGERDRDRSSREGSEATNGHAGSHALGRQRLLLSLYFIACGGSVCVLNHERWQRKAERHALERRGKNEDAARRTRHGK